MARRGRRPKASEKKQAFRVTVRLTGDEMKALEADAERRGWSCALTLLVSWRSIALLLPRYLEAEEAVSAKLSEIAPARVGGFRDIPKRV
mgnify:CR=1 FL=1